MIKIVHLITGLGTGGAETSLLRLVSRMDRSRFSNVVISMTDRGDIGDQIEAAGVPIATLGMKRGIPNPFALLALRRVLKRERPRILQTWLYHADLLGVMSARWAGVPVLNWNIRCSLLEITSGAVRVLSWLSSIPDAIIVNSQAGMRAHEDLGYRPRRWALIPNGFDLEAFKPDEAARSDVRRELSLDSEVKLVGVVARFDPMKDYPTLLHAASMSAADKNVHFVLLGDGVDSANAALSRLIADYDVGETVHPIGRRTDVARIYAALDVFCSSSAFGEGMQNAVGEAMSAAVPCVVTDVGDAAWLVGDTGRVVPPRDAYALAAALRQTLDMSSDERRQLGQAARNRIEQHFGIAATVAAYENLYEQLADRAAV